MVIANNKHVWSSAGIQLKRLADPPALAVLGTSIDGDEATDG